MLILIQIEYINIYRREIKMYSLEKPILENPFHPLDLSPEDLLRIYHRFEQSRQANKNSKQQLSIDTIAQLISSLKGVKPSYIQKCITQSFIKPTISWNDFLTLLDQEAEIRQKILDWVLFYDEGAVRKYRLQRYLPFRTKVERVYDFVTFMKLISLGEDKLCIIEVDHEKLYLVDITDGDFKQLDRFQKKNSKMNLQLYDSVHSKNNSKVINTSKIFHPLVTNNNKKVLKSHLLNLQSQKLITHNSISQGGNLRSSDLGSHEDQETYFKKQRKNIHSVFSIFKNLQIQDCIKLASVTASKIIDRSFNSIHANTIRDAFGEIVVPQREKVVKQTGLKNVTPFQKAQRKLKSLYEQKSRLSYNPYKLKRSILPIAQDLSLHLNYGVSHGEKKVSHERKQKRYTLQSLTLSFCEQISCLAIAYHNMQILILKVGKDLNKICFQQQDLIRITLQRDHKKSETIQSVRFYHHTIRDKWFLLVLIRVQYKTDVKGSVGESYVLGYQIQRNQKKRKIDHNYRFRCNNQQFSSPKRQTFCLNIEKFEGNILQTQSRFGIHLVSFAGKYLTFRQQYIQNISNPYLSQYWRLNNEQRFRNSNIPISCISIGVDNDKILFGTNNGNIVLYDSFSHKFKLKKISSRPIINVKISGTQGFALTRDQKVVILNLIKLQENNVFTTINDDKLHQKVLDFELDYKSKQIWTFGSEIKIYDQQINQDELHKKRQMQKTYTWRLMRLNNQTDPGNNRLKERIELTLTTHNRTSYQPELKSSQLVISSTNYFILLTQILQIIIITKSTLNIKFTFILGVPYDSKVMKMAISQSEKLLAVLLHNHFIYVYNIYTQQLCLQLKPSLGNFQKFVSLTFLDQKNQYMLAVGTESGRIALVPGVMPTEKKIVYLNYHKNMVNIVEVRNNYLVSCCQGGKICFWQLPFNVIKHQFTLPIHTKCITSVIGHHSTRIIYFKSIQQQIFEVNLSNSKIRRMKISNQTLDHQINNVMAVDPVTNQLIVVKKGDVMICKKSNDGEWVARHRVRIYEQKGMGNQCEESQYGQVVFIGIIDSQRAILFFQNGGVFPYIYQSQKIGKYINFNR